MSNGRDANLGVIKFMPQGSFEDPSHGLSPPEQREREKEILRALLDDEPREPPPRCYGDWARVSHAICRNGLFVIEASTRAFMVMLRFCPERPDAGDYEIHLRPHGGVERGHTYKVKTVPVGREGRTCFDAHAVSGSIPRLHNGQRPGWHTESVACRSAQLSEC